MFVGWVENLLAVLCGLLLPESPIFLLKLAKIDEAEKSYQRIAFFNRKPLYFNKNLFCDDDDMGATLTFKNMASKNIQKSSL